MEGLRRAKSTSKEINFKHSSMYCYYSWLKKDLLLVDWYVSATILANVADSVSSWKYGPLYICLAVTLIPLSWIVWKKSNEVIIVVTKSRYNVSLNTSCYVGVVLELYARCSILRIDHNSEGKHFTKHFTFAFSEWTFPLALMFVNRLTTWFSV